jgi:undecaprenyl-diphosphatase
MMLLKILFLAVIQGAAELLPVSSSAHVIVAAKLMGLNPVSPEMTLLLVMLHTGTMFAVLVYFRSSWKANYFQSREAFWNFAKLVAAATVFTGIVGFSLKFVIEKGFLGNAPHQEIEFIFGNMALIAASLFVVGLLIIYAGVSRNHETKASDLSLPKSIWIGALQGVCLPFRGFSRSGATISAGLLLGVTKARVEDFSFALAVILTPPVIIREVLRLLRAHADPLTLQQTSWTALFYPSLLGMLFSFAAGLLALKWVSRWLENGRWQVFGYYCLTASLVVILLYCKGL